MSLPVRVSGFATATGNFFHFCHTHLTFHLAIFRPVFRKLLLGCGFEFTDAINALIMESIR